MGIGSRGCLGYSLRLYGLDVRFLCEPWTPDTVRAMSSARTVIKIEVEKQDNSIDLSKELNSEEGDKEAIEPQQLLTVIGELSEAAKLLQTHIQESPDQAGETLEETTPENNPDGHKGNSSPAKAKPGNVLAQAGKIVEQALAALAKIEGTVSGSATREASALDPSQSATPTAAATVSVQAESEGTAHMGVGLLFFGFVLGITVGLSEMKGISQTLLSAMFTFVGGVLLSYAGFRRKQSHSAKPAAKSAPELSTRKVGIGLTCFSIGILLGLSSGIYVRLKVRIVPMETSDVPDGGVESPGPKSLAPNANRERQDKPAEQEKTDAGIGGATGKSSPRAATQKPGVPSLQSEVSTMCQATHADLQDGSFDGQEGCKKARTVLKDLTRICCP